MRHPSSDILMQRYVSSGRQPSEGHREQQDEEDSGEEGRNAHEDL